MNPRSEVIGSLLRPADLLEARGSLERGEITAADFKRIEDRAVDAAVALQQAAGLDVITDGEMRRYAFYGHLVEALEGFDKSGGWSITFRDGQGHEAALRRPVVLDRLRWRRQMSVEEFTYLRGRTSAPVKVTLVSAQQAAAYYDPDKSRGAYPTRDAYLADLVDFTRREITELGRLGCATCKSMRRNMPLCSTRRFAKDTASAERSRPAARRVHRARQRHHRWPRRHHLRHPHLPRQSQEHVLRVWWLRSNRGEGVRAGTIRSLLLDTTTIGRAVSNHYVMFRTTESSCWVW